MSQTTGHSLRLNESPSKFIPFNTKMDVKKTQRRLPHWHQDGVTYFVTFRLADSITREKIRELEQFRRFWLKSHPGPLTAKQKAEFRRTVSERIETYLDAGLGSCVLADAQAADILENALHHYDGFKYELGWYAIMPNHVHLLVNPFVGFDLSGILKSWKGVSSNEINLLTGRKGSLWLDESFDHIVRSWKSLKKFEEYIQENPTRAGLRPGTYRVGHGKGVIE